MQQGFRDFLDKQNQIRTRNLLPFETNIPILQANEMRRELPFVELSHSDQNFRRHYVVVKVVNDGGDKDGDNESKLYI